VKSKTRKPSWYFHDLALKIQVAPRHDTAKLLLIFLAAKASDEGYSYHGYRSIAAHLGKGHTAISQALQYLRDDLRLLNWERGFGGRDGRQTNSYQLDLDAMKNLVAKQGVFHPETGKLIYDPLSPEEKITSLPGVEVNLCAGREKSSAQDEKSSAEGHDPLSPEDRNPQEPSIHKNPHLLNQAVGSSFSPSSFSSSEGSEAGERLAQAPRCAAPPVLSAERSRTDYAGSAVTEGFLDSHAPAKSRRTPKTPLELAQGIKQKLEREAPDASILKKLPKNWESDWTLSLSYAITKEWATLDELRTLARFAVDHKLPEILAYGARGLVGSVDRIRQQMKEAEVKQ
jgi:hypothetical protein